MHLYSIPKKKILVLMRAGLVVMKTIKVPVAAPNKRDVMRARLKKITLTAGPGNVTDAAGGIIIGYTDAKGVMVIAKENFEGEEGKKLWPSAIGTEFNGSKEAKCKTYPMKGYAWANKKAPERANKWLFRGAINEEAKELMEFAEKHSLILEYEMIDEATNEREIRIYEP